MTSSKSKSNEPFDEFLAAIKLVSGEEILSSVIINADDDEKIILENPVVCEEVRTPGANTPLGYKFEPWMKMSDEDIFIVDLNRIITLSEIKDEFVIATYNQIITSGFSRQHPDLTKEMGYVNNVDKARQTFENLYSAEDASKDIQS
jgi:hypothetical protein